MRNYCAVFTVKFLGTNLNAIVLPCKLHDSAGKWRSCKSAVEESADAGGVVCKHWIELAVMLGHVTLGFKGWYCHFLEGYKGLFQSLMGLHRRLLMEYHGLLTRHFSEDMLVFLSVHRLRRGLIAVWELGQCLVILGFTVNCGVDIHINSKCFCSKWAKLQNCKGVFTSVGLGDVTRLAHWDLIP